ncbi:MAG: sensor domain-containing diguanylate cyclase [Candidatus Omnitrophota bacterium]|nr:sensor domain-containing diguanylate cyclase [Candidatus Omnitrophota bacterium]
MVNFNIMDELNKVKEELERTKFELGILYEISNAMYTTLKLDEILYIILTGVTAHIGLGFNRAMLFLVNEKEGIIEGRMAIGPDSGEDANRIWTQIEDEKTNLEDLISVYKTSNAALESEFNRQVRSIRLPLREHSGGLLAMAVLDGMQLHLNEEKIHSYPNDPVLQILNSRELVIIPLKSKEKVNGLILADNFITHEPISKEDIRMLVMLANQAGLAIENSQLYEKTVIDARSDYLTGLWNHGYFQFLLQSELDKAKATKKPLSVLMLDIDDFKVYNDVLGHQVGDRVLKELSTLLKNQCRTMDFICRYGGEEIAVILPRTEKKEAFLIAERLRNDIATYPFVKEEILPQKKLTVSMGLSSFPEDGQAASELVAASDKNLYLAKHKGKNNTCC